MTLHHHRPAPYADPLHAGRHPFQTFILASCVATGVPLVLGILPRISQETPLSAWVAITYGGVLVVGAIVALVGSYWPRGHYATALTLERVGLLFVGVSALLYGSIIAIHIGAEGYITGLITVGFGAAALKRNFDIRRIFTRAIHTVEHDPMPRADREDE